MNLKTSTAIVAIVAAGIAPSAGADVIKHSGMCDASAAAPVGSGLFVVANDEDNILRVYKRDESGEPVYSQDISDDLKIDKKEDPETDIEGAALIGKRIYWITSHGTNKHGDLSPNRHRFFATDIKDKDGHIHLKFVGTPFFNLVDALEKDNALKALHLGKAAKIAPKSENGLNIEGLTSTPEGTLLIGFRNPIPDKKALLVPLKNPQDIIDGKKKPKLGKPILLDLGGLGIRSIEYLAVKKAYFIIAGSYDGNDKFQLYQWSGNPSDAPELIEGIDFQGLNPETWVVYPEEQARIQILSDDGAELINGTKCKKLQPKDRSFRSIWVSLP